MTDIRKHVVIVGAGFGGITAAKKLNKKQFRVTLIDKNNYHNFQPLLYQVATGGLEPDSIAYPIRRIFRKHRNVSFRMAEVIEINPDARTIETSAGSMNYDILILATGGTNNFFNFDNVKDKLLVMKSVPDALNVRSFLMQNLEQALTQRDKPLEEQISIAIVGGGPTGVELAGALAEMKRYVLPKDFPELDISKMNIYLFEAGERFLGAMSKKASDATLGFLKQLGVDVQLNAKVKSYDGSVLALDNGKTFLTKTVIWTAGVKGNPPAGIPETAITRAQRIMVDRHNKVIGLENVYAIGDVSACVSGENPNGHPMLAPVAMEQAEILAQNLLNDLSGKPLDTYVYKEKGVMATIGRKKAVVDVKNKNFAGFFAWFIWMFVHLMSLVGFRNKIVTLIGWVANYFSYDRPLGLIIRQYRADNK